MTGGISGAQIVPRRKPSKFKNVRVRDDGIVFDSKREHARYVDLRMLQRAGEIERLTVHPRYPLAVNGNPICIYEADFRYFDVKSGREHVEDVKGMRTALFIIKRKLMHACLGISVEEVR